MQRMGTGRQMLRVLPRVYSASQLERPRHLGPIASSEQAKAAFGFLLAALTHMMARSQVAVKEMPSELVVQNKGKELRTFLRAAGGGVGSRAHAFVTEPI